MSIYIKAGTHPHDPRHLIKKFSRVHSKISYIYRSVLRHSPISDNKDMVTQYINFINFRSSPSHGLLILRGMR